MTTIAWTEAYSVGVESIDAQHRRLFEIAARLDEAIAQFRSQRVMKSIMAELIAYVDEHFAFEEMMLEQAGYPDLERHRAQHRRLLRRVEHFRNELCREHHRVGPDVGRFLQSWLANHILEDDKAYIPNMAGSPVEP